MNAPPNAPFAGGPLFPFNPFASMPMNPIPPPPIPAFAFQPPPTVPTNLEQLSDEELRALEGNERRNVEERIKVFFRNLRIFLIRVINNFLSTVAQKYSIDDGRINQFDESICNDIGSIPTNFEPKSNNK